MCSAKRSLSTYYIIKIKSSVGNGHSSHGFIIVINKQKIQFRLGASYLRVGMSSQLKNTIAYCYQTYQDTIQYHEKLINYKFPVWFYLSTQYAHNLVIITLRYKISQIIKTRFTKTVHFSVSMHPKSQYCITKVLSKFYLKFHLSFR